ncbi:Hypothetical predicted protein [Octopus vulgaris]|uniref:Mannan polymerase complex subunit mnn9 n=1 Tax=Octopus vulgaris TaxID=6645 RepID=A0AA36BV28_OCTVU|nr:Hypothetical predicted protein [Octopus vulgaris]
MYIVRRFSNRRSFCGSLAIIILLCCLVYALLGSHLRIIAVSNFQLIRKSLPEDLLRHATTRQTSSQHGNAAWHTNRNVVTASTLAKNISKLHSKQMTTHQNVIPKNVTKKLNSDIKQSNPKSFHETKHVKEEALKKDNFPKRFHIPDVPPVSVDDTVPYIPKPVINHFLTLPKREYTEEVLILTPIHNVADHLNHYTNLLKNLTYPRHLVSVALGEDCSTDETLIVAKGVVEELSRIFKTARLFHFNLTGQITGRWSVVHDHAMQLSRRSHLAKSRNLLLRNSLKDETWVMWIDSDVSRIPGDLVQQLISADKDVVVPSCLFHDGVNTRVYDKNTWRETNLSWEKQKHLPPNQLVLEGYGPSNRLYLPHLRAEGRLVPIDGVGGCSLLVRGDCHRKGLIFPEEIYQNHIETEGLSKMARTMEFSVYGMPFVEVYH